MEIPSMGVHLLSAANFAPDPVGFTMSDATAVSLHSEIVLGAINGCSENSFVCMKPTNLVKIGNTGIGRATIIMDSIFIRTRGYLSSLDFPKTH